MAGPDSPLGAILAGGLSSRLGGGDKTLRSLGGSTILDRVAGRLAPQCSGVVLNANGDPARFGPGWIVVPDDLPDRPGPLAGLLAVLDWAAARGVLDVVTVAADTPFLPGDLVQRLRDARAGAGRPAALARSGGRTHPVVGSWDVVLRDDLRREIGAGERRVGRWAARHDPAMVEWVETDPDPFFNVNTPDDLAMAERLLAAQRSAAKGR